MAGRPPLPIGSHGSIKRKEISEGVWEATARFRDADGITRQLRARAATGAKAEAALKQAAKERRNQGAAEELTRESTVSALIDRWLETLEPRRRSVTGTREGSLADGTVDTYRDIATRFLTPGIGGIRIRELNTQRAERFLSGCTAHRRHIQTVLSQVCGLGVRWNLLEYNPTREATPAPRPRSDKRILTPADVAELRRRTLEWQERKPGQGGPPRGYDMVEIIDLLMATGERTGEILALRWEDVAGLDDLGHPAAVTITGTIDRAGQRQDFPKSEHGYRILLLPEFGREALLRQRDRGFPFDLVFPSRTGSPRWKNNVNRSWREIRGEDFEWVTPRTFRKTAGTAIEREFGADAAAAQLGHSSPEVTRKHYIARAHEAPNVTAALDAFGSFPLHNRDNSADSEASAED